MKKLKLPLMLLTGIFSAFLFFLFSKPVPASAYYEVVTLASGLNGPYGIALDGSGNIYFTEYGPGSVKKLNSSGAVVATWTGFSSPCGIALDGLGNIYVAEGISDGSVKKLNSSGTVVATWTGFSYPNFIALDGSGNIYFTENSTGSIKKITPSGTVVTLASGVGGTVGIALDGSGNIYFVDSLSSIKKLTPSGTVVTLASGAGGTVGIALDGSGNIYFTEYRAGAVRKMVFHPDGSISGTKYKDISGNGCSGGCPTDRPALGGWEIILKNSVGVEVARTTTSTATATLGAYSFPNLAAGSYTVSETVQSGWIQTHPIGGVHTVTLSAGQMDKTLQDFYNHQPTYSIGDFVWEDMDGDGIQDPEEQNKGIVGMKIQLGTDSACDTATGDVNTGTNGQYSFTGVLPGTYYVYPTSTVGGASWGFLTKPLQGTNTSLDSNPRCSPVIITNSNDNTIDFGYYKGASITIQKVSDTGAILAGSAFSITGPDGFSKESIPGNWTESGLAPGLYTVTETTAPDGYNKANPISQTVTLTSGQTATLTFIDTPIVPVLGSISGRKINDVNGNGQLDAGEIGLSGWVINCHVKIAPTTWGWCSTPTKTTDATGAYSFTNLVAGEYKITEIDQGGWTATFPPLADGYPVTLTAGQTVANKNFYNKQNVSGLVIPKWAISPTTPPALNTVGYAHFGWGFNYGGASDGTIDPKFIGVPGFDGASTYTLRSTIKNDVKGITYLFHAVGCVSSGDITTVADCYSSTAKNRIERDIFVYVGTGETNATSPVDFAYTVPAEYQWCGAMQMDVNFVASRVDGQNWVNNSSLLGIYGVAHSYNYVNGQWVLVDACRPKHLACVSNSCQLVSGDGGNVDGCTTVDQPCGLGSISGRKINDLNGNGALDTGEVGLNGWIIELFEKDSTGQLVSLGTETTASVKGVDGVFVWENLKQGVYKLREVLGDSSWSVVYPPGGTYPLITLVVGQDLENQDFYNRKIATASCSNVTVTPTSGQENGKKGYYQLVTTYTMDPSKTLDNVTFVVTKEGEAPQELVCTSTTGNCVVDTVGKTVTYNNFLISKAGNYKFEATVTEK